MTSGPETQVSAVCLMRAGSFLNHNLRANCKLFQQRGPAGQLAFITTREIQKGDELFISYVDPTLPVDERNRILQTQYFIAQSESEI